MELEQETKNAILAEVMPIIGSGLAAGLVGAAAMVIAELVTTNYEEDTITGKMAVHPSEDDLAVSKADVTGSEVDGSLKADSATISEGQVKANSLDAKASTGEATASDNGATAMESDAGAMHTGTQALNLM